LGYFSLFYTAAYSLAAWRWDRSSLPGLTYFVVLAILYVLLWLPFYLPGLLSMPKALEKFVRRLIDRVTATSLDVQTPPLESGTLMSPRFAQRPAGSRWPVQQAALVQLLAASIIVLTAWYSTYSGGPVRSPYGQILLALPLLSPNIAHSSKSILAVYGLTMISAVVAAPFSGEGASPPNPFYWATTIGVLVISAFVAWATRWKQERVQPRASTA
jgi:hypothetical protein